MACGLTMAGELVPCFIIVFSSSQYLQNWSGQLSRWRAKLQSGRQGCIQDFRKGVGGVVSRQQPLWGVRERGTRDDFENMDREIRHLQCISGIFVFPKGGCNPLNLPPGSAPERDVGSSC